MTFRLIFLLFLCAMTLINKGQDLKHDKDVSWKFEYHPLHAPLGLIYQNELLYQIGQRFAFRRKIESVSFCLNAQIQIRNVTYISPTFLISYYKPIKKMVGPVINMEYSIRKIEGLTCNTLTPEVGLGFYWFSFNFGYNITLDNSFPWTTPYRLSLRLIFP